VLDLGQVLGGAVVQDLLDRGDQVVVLWQRTSCAEPVPDGDA
jgi:hypothetical protein